jgi:hypothetical protein
LGLAAEDRKDLEWLIKASLKEAKTPISLARKMMPRQGNIEDFAYGLITGMIIGNFTEQFKNKNRREPDTDEIVEIFSIMRRNMPAVRKSIINELGDY